jgi:hypothetical protein
MSVVAYRAFAQEPSESNFEGLTKRLLALRAEIDAILLELASHATAMSQAAVLTAEPMPVLAAPAGEPAAAIEPDMLPAPSDTSADDAPMPEAGAMVEAAEAAFEPIPEATEPGEPTEMIGAPEMAAAAANEQPDAEAVALEPVEVEPYAHAWTEPTSEEAAPMAALDTIGETELAPPAEIAATEAVSAEPAMLEATQASASQAAESEERPEPLAAPMDIAPAAADAAQTADSPVMPASAAIISLNARQRKHKGGVVIGPPKRTRSGRFLAAKIAAGILVLLTAATLLMIADRSAMGGVPSLNWMPQAPSVPTGIEWLLQRINVGAAELSGNVAADPLPLGDPLASLAWGA